MTQGKRAPNSALEKAREGLCQTALEDLSLAARPPTLPPSLCPGPHGDKPGKSCTVPAAASYRGALGNVSQNRAQGELSTLLFQKGLVHIDPTAFNPCFQKGSGERSPQLVSASFLACLSFHFPTYERSWLDSKVASSTFLKLTGLLIGH